MCKIRTDGDGYYVDFTSKFGVNGHEITQWFSGYISISCTIRLVIQKYEKGQKNMMTLSDLRDYIQQELGNLVAAVYEPGKSDDRIKVNRGGLWVCSVYRNKPSNGNLFTVIFYDPFICRPAGYSSVIDLTVAEVPRAIKNRIDICENDNRIDINIDNNTVEKTIYMTARGSGKTRWISDLLKSLNVNIKYNIKDVIFNDPATIVFWVDGSKTVVKCQPEETFDPEKGLAMAISKKVLGNDYGYYEVFAKYVGRHNKISRKKYIKAIDDVLSEIAPDEIIRDGVVYKRVEESDNKTNKEE